MAKTFQNTLFIRWLLKLNGLEEKYYFNEIALKGTEMCIEVMSYVHKSCVGLCFLDPKNETFSQYHWVITAIINLEQFSI